MKAALKEDVRRLRQDNEKLKQELNSFRQLVSVNQGTPMMDDRSLTFDQLAEGRQRATYAVERRSLISFPSAIASARAILPPIYSEVEMLFHLQYSLAYPLIMQQMRPGLCDTYVYVYGLVVAINSRMKRDHRQHREKQPQQPERFQSQIHGTVPPLPVYSVNSSLYNVVREEDINIRRWTSIAAPIKHVLGGIKLYWELIIQCWVFRTRSCSYAISSRDQVISAHRS